MEGKEQKMDFLKSFYVVCDFRSNRDEPVGTLVDEYDTNHKNPQFTVMVDCGILFIILC